MDDIYCKLLKNHYHKIIISLDMDSMDKINHQLSNKQKSHKNFISL